jgi:hypothetical protein
MNATRPLFPYAVRTAAGLSAAIGALTLGGCIGDPFRDHKADPASPVAAEVNQRSRAATKFPTFASIPNPPKDIRPAPQYGRAARGTAAAGQALLDATAPGTWTLKDTDAFASKAQKDVGPALEPANPADAEAFAKALRERATPPPPR